MKQFKLYGTTIEFSDDVMDYNKICLIYSDVAVASIDNFEGNYKDLKDANEYREKINGIASFYIEQAIEIMVDHLIKLGIYDVSFNRIAEKYGEFILEPWFAAYDAVEDEYLRLDMNEALVNEKRTERRRNRGRFIGGGFGLSGAAKGIAAAEALNMTTGAVHGLVNVVGGGITGLKNSIKADTIFRAKETVDILRKGLYKSILNLHTIHCRYVGIDVSKLPFDEQRVFAIIDNYSRIPKHDRKKVLCECVRDYPYFHRIYQVALADFGDSNNELGILAKTFGLQKAVEEYKWMLLDALIEIPANISCKEAKELRMQLQSKMSYFGVIDCPKLHEISKVIDELDEKERTFDGIVYGTIEETRKARVDAEFCKKLLNECNNNSDELYLENLCTTVQKNCTTEAVIANTCIKIKQRIASNCTKNHSFSEAEKAYWEIKEIIQQNFSDNKIWQEYSQEIDREIISLRCKEVNYNLYTEDNVRKIQKIMNANKKDFPYIPYDESSRMEKTCKIYYYLTFVEKCALDDICVAGEDKFNENLFKAEKAYAAYTENEIPFLLYDSSSSKNAEQGFLLTNKNLYVNNGVRNKKTSGNTKKIPLYTIIGFSHDNINDIYCTTSKENFLIMRCIYAQEADRWVEVFLKLIEATKMNDENILNHVRKSLMQSSQLNSACTISKLSDSQLQDKALKYIKMYELLSTYPVGSQKFNEKLPEAKSAYADYTADERPFLLYDSTLMGNGNVGFLLTDKNIYFNKGFRQGTGTIPLNKIRKVFFKKVSFGYDIHISTSENSYPVSFCSNETDAEKVKDFFTHVIDLNRLVLRNKKDRNISVQELIEITSDLVYKYKLQSVYIVGTKPFEKKLPKAQEVYAGYKYKANEKAIAIYDATVFGGAKEGFVLTNKNIYVNNYVCKKRVFPILQIKEVSSGSQADNNDVYLSTSKERFKVVVTSIKKDIDNFVAFFTDLIDVLTTETEGKQ